MALVTEASGVCSGVEEATVTEAVGVCSEVNASVPVGVCSEVEGASVTESVDTRSKVEAFASKAVGVCPEGELASATKALRGEDDIKSDDGIAIGVVALLMLSTVTLDCSVVNVIDDSTSVVQVVETICGKLVIESKVPATTSDEVVLVSSSSLRVVKPLGIIDKFNSFCSS